MTTNKAYTVAYKTYGEYNDTQYVTVLAKNKYEAYDKAVWEAIPEKEGRIPYGAWVFSVTYQNGNYRKFNTFCGLPY